MDPLGWLKGAVFATALRMNVAGKPVPCPRPRVTRTGQVFYPKNYTDWRVQALPQLLDQKNGQPFDKPVHVAVEAVVERPKKTVRLLPGGDVDNYAKSLLDALTKALAWVDDDLVECLIVRKRWADRGEVPGFNVMIGAVGA